MLKTLRRYFFPLCLSGFIACSLVIADPWVSHAQQSFAQANVLTQTSAQTNAVREASLQYLNISSTIPARVDRIAVSENFALVSWVRGETGGTALLRKNDGSWKVVVNGGGLIGVQEMVDQGVTESTAESLLTQIDPQWRTYSAPQ
jgi:hypothetical protein